MRLVISDSTYELCCTHVALAALALSYSKECPSSKLKWLKIPTYRYLMISTLVLMQVNSSGPIGDILSHYMKSFACKNLTALDQLGFQNSVPTLVY